MHTTAAGSAEITITCQPVRFLKRFILYCIRYGLKTFNFYGTKIGEELKKIDDIARELTRTGVEEVDLGECKKYIEERKQEKHRIGSEKRKNIVDVIALLIEENNIGTFAEWELKIEYDTKEQLLKDFGLQVDTYASKIIKNKRNNKTSMYKYDSYEKITIRDLDDKYANNLENRINAIKWIYDLFDKNNINIIEFFAWTTAIKNMDFVKINGLVLEGPTNAGKSLIIDNTIRPLKPEDIPRERERQQRIPSRSTSIRGLRHIRGTDNNTDQRRNMEITARGKNNKNRPKTSRQGGNRETTDIHDNSDTDNGKHRQQRERTDKSTNQNNKISVHDRPPQGGLHTRKLQHNDD